MLADADSDHQRTAAPRGNQTFRFTVSDYAQRIGAIKLGGSAFDGVNEHGTALKMAVYLVHDDFGIGFRSEFVSVFRLLRA